MKDIILKDLKKWLIMIKNIFKDNKLFYTSNTHK